MLELRSAVRVLMPLAVAAVLLPLAADRAGAAPGDLDPTFGTGGTLTSPIGSSDDLGSAVAIQSDGKIVAAGSTRNGSNDDFALARYTTSGALDTTFGSGGTVTTAIGSSHDVARAVAIQSDGKIVVAGQSLGSNFDFALARYTTSGALDTTFGSGGTVTTGFGSGDDFALGVAIQSDGKIVAAGGGFTGSTFDLALARYTASGALDTSFGSGGTVTTAILSSHDLANAVAIQSDGKIVAAGQSLGFGYDFALARYTASGALDTTFGTGGTVTTAFGSGDDVAYAMAVQSDGKIVAAGSSVVGTQELPLDFALARYTASGALDTTFGTGGTVTTAFGSGDDVAYAMAVQSDGKIVAAGYGSGPNFPDFALARFTASGALDTTFGTGGKVTTAIGSSDDFARAVAIQADGRIVAAGYSLIGSRNDFALARYLADSPTVSIADASVSEGDSGSTNMTFTVSLAGAGPNDVVSVQYATSDGSATSPADYSAKSGTLKFGVGQTTKTISVAVKSDLIHEENETFSIRLANPEGATIDNGTATGSITDDDPIPNISVSDQSLTEGNSGTVGMTFTVSLSNPSSDPILVDFATADATATSPSDYQARSGTKLFRPGQTTKSVTVFVNGETAQEPDETFTLNLFDSDGATVADGTGVGTILDDDRPAISINDVSATEVDSGATVIYGFKVTLSKAGTGTVTVQFATANGTAVAPGDYTAKSGTLTYSPGQVSKTVSVTVKGDTAVEPNETFFVNLSNATGASIADGQGVGTIVNDD